MVLLTTENQSYGTMVWTSLRPGSAINPAWPILLNVCDQVVSDYVNEYQLLATAHQGQYDMSLAYTHKREIITLYLQGYLTPTIAETF